MTRFKAKLWGDTILDIEVDPDYVRPLQEAIKQVQGHYFLLGATVSAFFGMIAVFVAVFTS